MRKPWLILLFSFFTMTLYANSAVNDINQLLAKPSTVKAPKPALADYYFIYVFKSTCPHCHKFTPLIKDLADSLVIPLKAYSIDGQTMSNLPFEPMTPQLFDTLFTGAGFKPVVPALFLANQETGQVYAVSFGESNAVDLASRLNELLAKIKERFDA